MRTALFAITLVCAALLAPTSSHAQMYGYGGWHPYYHPHVRYLGPPVYRPPYMPMYRPHPRYYPPPVYYGPSYAYGAGQYMRTQSYTWYRTTVTHWSRTYQTCGVCGY